MRTKTIIDWKPKTQYSALNSAGEVERSLVGLLDFKSSGRREKRLRWVRFPCTSAIYAMKV